METTIDLCYETADSDIRSTPLDLATLPFEALFDLKSPEASYWNLREYYDKDPVLRAMPEDAIVAICCSHLEDVFGGV
jgi:hypothetical protein